MPDSLPSSADRTVIVQRHGALTYISLGLNALVLLLILIGIVCHHNRPPQPPRDRDGDERGEAFDRGGHFGHHGFGGMRHEWKHRESEDRDGESCGGPGEDAPREVKMDRPRGWDAPGDRGDHQPPTAEAMTDRFMLALTGKLTLTDQESAQIRPIVQQGVVQFQKDLAERKDAHQKMIDDAKTKIRTVLTPDQQKTFDAMTAQFGAAAAGK